MGGAGDAVAAGGLAGLAGDAEEVVPAGGLAVAGVCATASETRRGSPTSAPVIQIRSIMQQNPAPQGRASCAARVHFIIPIKVTNLSPRLKGRWRLLFRPLRRVSRKCKGRPEAAFEKRGCACGLSLDAGRKPVVPGSPITGDAETANTERHERPSGGFRRRISGRPVRQADRNRTITSRNRNAARIR
jgi:hypothetical protein